MRIRPRYFIVYKGVNSLFTGLTVGAVFTIYAPLDPSVFSVGGIVLALGMLWVARLYEKILNLKAFFRISLFVEWVMLMMVAWYLLRPEGKTTALAVYAGYQLTFLFGSYLVRAETLFLRRKALLSRLDSAKQIGYLAGMVLSWLFYRALVWGWGIKDHGAQVYALHFLLFGVELLIIFLLLRAFEKRK
ncbi:MAG: hypothetical protein GXO33_01725 [Epsilonproteobacteria bacterium]|nr:hypothetical protein [Campylobacterota bacterium]